MAVSSTSRDINSYTLSEFVKLFELPKRAWVTKGQEERNEKTAPIQKFEEGQFFLLERLSSVPCLSGVTRNGGHKVCIPIDCPQKVEIPSLCTIDESVHTVRDLLARSPLPAYLKYVRALGEERLSDKLFLKAGQTLRIQSTDKDDESLTAINEQGCLFRIPVSCSVPFRLLSSRDEYLLSDLVASSNDIFPTYIRFVDAVSPDLRRTFFEESHAPKLGAIYLEKELCVKRGIEAIFNDPDDYTQVFWLPIDIDIKVTETDLTTYCEIVEDSVCGGDSESETETATREFLAEKPAECFTETTSTNQQRKPASDPLPNTPCNLPYDVSVIPALNDDQSGTDVITYEIMGCKNSAEEVTPTSPPSSSKPDNLSDISTNLSTLSMKEVMSLLERMNLGHYAKKFENEQVDGSLLVGLDKEVLVSHFELSDFHAMKLAKFVKGWRPNASAFSDDSTEA